ncbi:MAG: hypothetical protein UW03_C0037G0018 [Candidatus Peregrinibacteria bacterium GW2011_GWA2_43_8]|nr:MAG: hypothetical protein UW03_C0037G0018 [Candidatus Peregrinibacteria bacterium GW2011_GWA2_43_8]
MSKETPRFEPEKRETQPGPSLAEGEKSLKKKPEPVNLEAFERQVHTLVQSSKDRLKDLPKSFQDSLHDNLVQYLRTSVERYDTDAEVGLSKDEFEKYKRDMLQKVSETIARYTPSAEILEAKKQQKEGAVDAAQAAQESAAIEIKDTNFNEASLQTPQGIQQELAKFNMQSADMHKEVGSLSVNIGDFQQAFQRFEEGKNDWSVFLRGSPFVDDPETEQLRTQLSTLKRTLDEKMQKLEEKKRTLSEYGQKLNGAGDTMKRQKIDERDGKFREIDEQGTQAEQTQKKNETQYRALEAQQQKLYGQRDAMADYHDDLVQGLAGISASREQVQVHSDQFGEFNGQLEAAVAVIDDALANTPPSPQREQLEAKKAELLGHKENVDAAIFQTQGAETELGSAEQTLQGKRGETESTLLTLDTYLANTVNPGMEALTGSIQALEIAKLQNGTQREQIEAQYAEILQTIDTVDAAVADNVLENNLANEQAIASLVTQKQSLDAISIDRPNLWNATGGLVFGKIGEGWSLLTKDVVCGMLLDPASKWLKEVTKDIPVLNVITEVGANVIIDFPSGVIEGAGELVNGVATMIAHPVDAIAGIGTLIGRNPQTGEWSLSSAGNAWREMGKALIAYENFEKGEVGKGVGKVALNVLLTATGIGAGAKGAQAASIAYSVARASGAGVARASLRAAGTGARLFAGEFSHGVARLPGEALSATGKLLRAPGRLLENMKVGTAGRLGKEISEMGDELATASKGLEDFTIGGKKVSELEAIGGKNSRELAKLSPDDLAKAGIKDSGAIREFLEYKGALQKSERLQGSIRVLSHRKEIIQIAPELEAAFKLKGARLQRFIDEFNTKYPDGFPEKSFKKIRESKEGVLAFNAKGTLQLFENEVAYQAHRSRAVLDKYLQARFSQLDEATRTQKINAYQQSIDFISDKKTQAELNKIFEGLDGVPDEALQQLRAYTERHALEQHFENPEQYVSHGFDHSLNVKHHMENAMRDNPQIVETMMKKYGISKAESVTMMRMMAVYHDFGYPEVGELGKALHGVIGAEIAATDEFLAIMKDVIGTKGAKFDELMFDFKNGILYHSADKVEIFRDAKIKIAHGEFIIDADNIVHIYHRFSGAGRKEKIQVVCTEAVETKMKAELSKGGIAYDTFEFRRPVTGEITVEGKFRGRGVDLTTKGDEMLGLQYREVTLLDDPMNYMIRLTDNLDMTAERFSEVQRTEAFREIYRIFGPLEGQKPPTGKLLEALERCKKGKMDMAEVLADPQFKAILDKLSVDTQADIGIIIKTYKERLIDDVMRNPRYANEVETHGNRIREIGIAQNTGSVRHFGGCESVKGVRLSGKNLTVTVDRARFEELNRTKVSELSYKADGTTESVKVGIGEYQIWRAYEASRSLGGASEKLLIRVIDESGNPIIADFERHLVNLNS